MLSVTNGSEIGHDYVNVPDVNDAECPPPPRPPKKTSFSAIAPLQTRKLCINKENDAKVETDHGFKDELSAGEGREVEKLESTISAFDASAVPVIHVTLTSPTGESSRDESDYIKLPKAVTPAPDTQAGNVSVAAPAQDSQNCNISVAISVPDTVAADVSLEKPAALAPKPKTVRVTKEKQALVCPPRIPYDIPPRATPVTPECTRRDPFNDNEVYGTKDSEKEEPPSDPVKIGEVGSSAGNRKNSLIFCFVRFLRRILRI